MDELFCEAEEICELLEIKRSTLNWWIAEKREIYRYLTKICKRPVITHDSLLTYLAREVG